MAQAPSALRKMENRVWPKRQGKARAPQFNARNQRLAKNGHSDSLESDLVTFQDPASVAPTSGDRR